MNFLSKVLMNVRADVRSRSKSKPIDNFCIDGRPRQSLVEAIERASDVPLIAEIKRASPSAGDIRLRADPVHTAQLMLHGGAISLSVLTEPRYFKGDPSFLSEIRKVTDVPLLYKDFIVDEYQLYEAAEARADAVLLIAKVLGRELRRFMALVEEFGMESLVEVTNEKEVKMVGAAGAKLIGVNNRDLQTLSVNLNLTVELAPTVPKDVTLVSESGISSPGDVIRMINAGADAVLVGTAIMKEKDIEGKVRSLVEAR